MRFFKMFNTVFYRLIFSYLVLIVLLTILMVGTSYIYVTYNFNNEVEKMNARMLNYIKNNIDVNVFDRTQRIYVDTVVTFTKNEDLQVLFDQPIEGNHAQIYQVYNVLRDIANAHTELIESLEIYFKHNHIVISSLNGYQRLEEGEERSSYFDWSSMMHTDMKAYYWMNNNGSASLVGSFPYPLSGLNKGTIAIHVRESAIANLLSESTSSDEMNRMYISMADGTIPLQKDLADAEVVEDASLHENYFLADVQGLKSMVSYTTLEHTGWKLINITPVEQFYQKSNSIQKTILLIGVIAMVLGVLVSNLLTINVYNPLKLILNRVRKLFHGEITEKNEYKVIDNLIDNLSVKVSDLESTLKEYMPVVKSRLVEDLLKGTFSRMEELDEKLQFLSMGSLETYKFFCVATFQFDKEVIENISLENAEYIKFNLLHHIETLNEPRGGKCLATEYEQKIHLIICSQTDHFDLIYRMISNIVAYAYSNLMVPTVASVGRWVDHPLKVSASFKEAAVILKYHYFRPDSAVLYGDYFLQRDQSEVMLDGSCMERFAKALKMRDRKKVKEEISRFVDELKNGPYSAEHAHEKMIDMIYLHYSFVKELNYSTRDIFSESMLYDYYQFQHIDQFKLWIETTTMMTLDYIEKQQREKTSEIIERVKQHIEENLEGDLFLDAVAELVNLSPRYFSRVFKMHTGENFSDFVTKRRLMRSAEMIRKYDWSIEMIAQQVGYHNPAYFTKRFKDYYKVTPTQYRNQHMH